MAAPQPHVFSDVVHFTSSLAWLEPYWNFVRLTAPIATALLALLVFVEARGLRKLESLSKSIGNWQDFNKLVMDETVAARWAAIRHGRVVWADMTQKDLNLIYSFLNVLVFEYKAARYGALWRRYVDKSFRDNILYFKHIWPGLHHHLLRDGWPTDVLKAADRIVRRARRREGLDRPKP
jgi:hypothetical protein